MKLDTPSGKVLPLEARRLCIIKPIYSEPVHLWGLGGWKVSGFNITDRLGAFECMVKIPRDFSFSGGYPRGRGYPPAPARDWCKSNNPTF